MIELVPFTEYDIDRLIGWIGSPEMHLQWTASVLEYPLTREQMTRLMRESAERGDRLLFRAVDPATGETVGHLELGAIDRRNRSLRVGRVMVDPARRGRGIGGRLMRAALETAFGQMGMHRVELIVFDFNHAAIACYERAGFRREGMRRETLLSPGGWWNEVVMGILEEEWRSGR